MIGALEQVHRTGSPIVVRVAGLPAEELDPLCSPEMAAHLAELEEVERALELARGAMTDQLFSLIRGAPREERRLLLAMKRDSFNGRDLGGYREQLAGRALEAAIAPALSRVLDLSAARSECLDRILRTREDDERRETASLVDILGHRSFLRGVALSSIDLVANLHRLRRRRRTDYGTKERRALLSLARYVTRAAVKLSPFSTLTRIGTGLISEAEPHRGVQLVPLDTWRTHSKVRLQRFLTDQLASLLIRYPPFRERTSVSLNETTEAIGDERYRFLRPGSWSFDAEEGRLKSIRPALVKATLVGPLIGWLLCHLQPGVFSYRDLLVHLEAEFPDWQRDDLHRFLERLVEMGFLLLTPPWSASDLHVEKQLANFLRSLPKDPEVSRLVDLLERMLELERRFAEADAPLAVVTDGKRIVREMLRLAAGLAGEDIRLADAESKEWFFYEDVLVESTEGGGELLRWSRREATSLLSDLAPLARLANLGNPRYEFLHTLAAFADSRWPGRPEVQFTDVFEEGYSLFEEFVRFRAEHRKEAPLGRTPFDPLELEPLAQLRRVRLRAAERLPDCYTEHDGQISLDRALLEELLDDLPAAYAGPRNFCAFLQPTVGAGSPWVLNMLTEGAGRLSSRYTAAMERPLRNRFTSHFETHSCLWMDGELVELVDLYCPAGHTANVHAPQTRRVFEIPGEPSGLPPARRLPLRALRVRFPGRRSLPRLVDRDGRHILPVHLGALAYPYMPSIIKFLTLFGPEDLRYRAPHRGGRRCGEATVLDRHRIGDVIYLRKTWSFDPVPFAASLKGLSASEVLLAVHRWRTGLGLPQQVFAAEPLNDSPNAATKPQYIDFTSSTLVEIFHSIVRGTKRRSLTVSEALPRPQDLPSASDGRRWATELQLDCIGFPPFSTTKSTFANAGEADPARCVEAEERRRCG